MPSSLREQVLARAYTALLNNTPAGSYVYRSRETSIRREQTPAITIMPASTELSRTSTQVDRNHFDMKVEIFTRGDPWDSLADSVDVAAHKILTSDATLLALVSDIRRIHEDFEAIEADRTAGTLTLTYRVTYLTRAGDVSLAP